MKNDFHREVRVVYRAMRRSYGTEKVQDECLRVFKVVFPLLHKARQEEDYFGYYDGFPEESKERVRQIFGSWNPDKALAAMTRRISERMDKPFTKESFTQFCEDITPVAMRIRKLTPRECFRLQGVGDRDIDKLLAERPDDDASVKRVLSNSSLYKLAGNSITAGGNFTDSQGNVDGPLYNLFRKMFIDTEPDMVKGEAHQLELF